MVIGGWWEVGSGGGDARQEMLNVGGAEARGSVSEVNGAGIRCGMGTLDGGVFVGVFAFDGRVYPQTP